VNSYLGSRGNGGDTNVVGDRRLEACVACCGPVGPRRTATSGEAGSNGIEERSRCTGSQS